MGLIRLPPDHAEAGALALTQEGVIIGTIDYLAPEQARNARRVDRRADVYSMGCTLYHLLAGRPVFSGDTPFDKILRHQTDQPPSLRKLRPDVPVGLEKLIGEMLAKRPEKRTPTAADIAIALAPFASKAPATAVMRRKAAVSPLPTSDLSALEPTRMIAEGGNAGPSGPNDLPAPRRKRRWWLFGG
jgi:serine/threonine-protein kinase